MRALVLSAGLGERLRPLTLKRAKPAIEFLNVPMLAYPYHWLESVGLTDLVFNTHYLPDTVRHAAMHVVHPEVRLHFSHENEILGSGGGIWQARFDLMQESTFAVANGDGVVIHPDPNMLVKMLKHHERTGALATLLVCPLDGVGDKIPGVWVDSSDRVQGFGKSKIPGSVSCLHYASYIFFSDRIWPLLPEGSSNILYDVLEPAIKTGARVEAFRATDLKWFETGNVSDYLSATEFCLNHLRDNTPLGRCLLDIIDSHGQSIHLKSRLNERQVIADSAHIDQGAVIEGFAVLGENCRVGRGARIANSVILSGTEVPPGAQIVNQVLIE